MDILSLIITTIGAIPVIVAFFYWLYGYRPAKQFLSFTDREPVDVIVTTSAISQSDKGAEIVRATTGIGQLEGVAFLSRVLGRFYRKKPISLKMSKKVTDRLNRDLVLLGGPAKNEFSAKFISEFNEENSELEVTFDDINCSLNISDFSIDSKQLKITDGFPEDDYAIVFVWKNPFAVELRRGILCAGFTSYGTSGAANWLFDDVIKRTKGLSGKKFPYFLAILHITLIKDQVIGIRLDKLFPIKG
jgi:hypothetical protein